MQHPTHRLIHVVALVSIAALCLGNECGSPTSEGGTGGSPGTGGTGASGGTGGSGGGVGGTGGGSNVAGRYLERFSCKLDDGTCLEDDVRIEMDVTVENGDYEIVDLGSNAIAIGTLAGNVLSWTSEGTDFPGFSESGTWTFAADGTTFVKASTFMQDQGSPGECTGSGRLQSEGEPAAPPPFMKPCTP